MYSTKITNYNNEKLPPDLYHYTSLDGLLGIITDKSIWATDIRFLNDSSEFQHSFTILEKAITKHLIPHELKSDFLEINKEKEFLYEILSMATVFSESTTYVTSLSEKGDLLSQWRGYCPNGNGFCIGFDTKKLQEIMSRHNYELLQCIYDEKEQNTLLYNLVKMLCANFRKIGDGKIEDLKVHFINEFLSIVPKLKDASFEEEKEWRFSYAPEAMLNGEELLFRKGKSFIIPYTAVPLKENRSGNPINRIIIGPTPHKELSLRSLKGFLESKELDNIDIVCSEIPFRNW